MPAGKAVLMLLRASDDKNDKGPASIVLVKLFNRARLFVASIRLFFEQPRSIQADFDRLLAAGLDRLAARVRLIGYIRREGEALAVRKPSLRLPGAAALFAELRH